MRIKELLAYVGYSRLIALGDHVGADFIAKYLPPEEKPKV